MPRSKKPKRITKEQFDRWSPEKQQRALNDRRTRIRIEDRALPKEWLDRRNTARRNRTPITPGSGTTYGDLAKQRAYLEPLTFGEGDRQLSDRTANLAAARQRDADWFTQYRADVAAAQQRAIGAQSQAAEGNRALIDSANQVSASGRDAVVRQLQDRAAQLGQAPQGGEYQALADQAAAARATSLANTAQRQIADANTNVGLATDAVGTAALKDREAQGYRDRQQGALDQDKKDYGSKKDAWRAKFIDDAIAEARKQVLEDRAFGATQADREADNARADKSLTIQERRLREQRRAARERERLARERESRQAAGGGGGGGNKSSGPKPATPKETRTQAAAIRRAVTLIQYMKRAGKDKNGVKYTTGGIRAALAQKGIDSDVVNTAMDVVYLGGIGKVNRRRWKKAGYNPRSFGQPFQKGR
jgi:hypothetical protein